MTGPWTVMQAEVLEALRGMPDASFDGVVCDPPYGLGTREPTGDEIVAYLRCESGIDTGGDFMGKDWQLPSVAELLELRRVLKPGAHVLAFGGSRTFDLLTVGLRASGFEIRDTLLAWVHGQGWAKGLDVSRAIDESLGASGDRPEIAHRADGQTCKYLARGVPCPGHGDEGGRMSGQTVHKSVTQAATPEAAAWDGYATQLKPSYEPIVCARVPLDGTVAENALAHGVGAFNVDGCRLGSDYEGSRAGEASAVRRYGEVAKDFAATPGPRGGAPEGRYPPNTLLVHGPGCQRTGTRKVAAGKAHRTKSGGAQFGSGTRKPPMPDMTYAGADGKEETSDWTCEPGCPVRLLDEQSGLLTSGTSKGYVSEPRTDNQYGTKRSTLPPEQARGDTGHASRFFPQFQLETACFKYAAKASRAEREFGCEALPKRRGRGNPHVSVKPLAVTKWLATLLLPPARADGRPRRLLVPWLGSGSEAIGALRAGWDEVVGIERDPESVAIAEARLARWSVVRPDVDEADAVAAVPVPSGAGQGSLFGGAT